MTAESVECTSPPALCRCQDMKFTCHTVEQWLTDAVIIFPLIIIKLTYITSLLTPNIHNCNKGYVCLVVPELAGSNRAAKTVHKFKLYFCNIWFDGYIKWIILWQTSLTCYKKSKPLPTWWFQSEHFSVFFFHSNLYFSYTFYWNFAFNVYTISHNTDSQAGIFNKFRKLHHFTVMEHIKPGWGNTYNIQNL